MKTAAVTDFPAYWDEACLHLMKKDRVMRKLIPQFGDARLVTRGDLRIRCLDQALHCLIP